MLPVSAPTQQQQLLLLSPTLPLSASLTLPLSTFPMSSLDEEEATDAASSEAEAVPKICWLLPMLLSLIDTVYVTVITRSDTLVEGASRAVDCTERKGALNGHLSDSTGTRRGGVEK